MSHPDNLTLLRGGMRNWSDLEHSPAGASPAARAIVREAVRDARRVAVVGPHASDLITGLVDAVPEIELTVIVRSMQDALLLGELLQEDSSAQVVCGDLVQLELTDTFDVVIALDDVTRLTGPETGPARWADLFAKLAALVAPDGRLLFAAENELGLHRMTALRSRYTSNADDAWSVTDSYDVSRPRTRERLGAAIAAQGLRLQTVGVTLPTWQDQTVWAVGVDELGAAGPTVLAAACLSSPAFRQVGSDPTRLTRAAVLGEQLQEVASGWWALASRAAADSLSPMIVASTRDGQVARFTGDSAGLRADGAAIPLQGAGTPFGETMLDAAADGDLSVLRQLVMRLVDYVGAHAESGSVDAAYADARPDNLIDGPDGLTPLLPAADGAPAHEVLTRALADLVHIIRARGARHPWPSATDDETMLASLLSMGRLTVPEDLMPYLGSPGSGQPQLPAADVAGLIAVIDRLTETNAALTSRATWFENRLRSTERDMQVRAERYRTQLAAADRQREVLRASAEDLRRSITYRIGNAIIGPVRTLRNNTRD